MKTKVLILGGGAGGLSVAARLAKVLPAQSVAVIEPSSKHYYQPLWTLVGAGVVDAKKTEREQAQLIPKGVEWIRHSVKEVRAARNQVVLTDGATIDYETLVVATGLRLAWEKIKGLEGHLGQNGICSIYEYSQAPVAAKMLENFRGGQAIFTMPPVPIKCAGAPQKIMYLADEIFRRNGVRESSEIKFATAGGAMFGVPVFSAALDKVVARKGIQPLFQHRLIEVKAQEKRAVFETLGEAGATKLLELKYDLLHVVPPMEAHAFVRESGLAFTEGPQKGWLKVDKETLRHQDFANVYGIGDVTGVPNSKTGAAIRKQAPVVVHNILQTLSGGSNLKKYDGYASCPLVTGFGKVMLAEFGYDGKLMPSFPLDPTVERRSMWILKKDLLPHLYWSGMLRGRA